MAIDNIFNIGIIKNKTIRIMPKIPIMLLIEVMHLKKSSTVSDVKPPMIGMKLLRENLAVLIKSPSDVSVNNP